MAAGSFLEILTSERVSALCGHGENDISSALREITELLRRNSVSVSGCQSLQSLYYNESFAGRM